MGVSPPFQSMKSTRSSSFEANFPKSRFDKATLLLKSLRAVSYLSKRPLTVFSSSNHINGEVEKQTTVCTVSGDIVRRGRWAPALRGCQPRPSKSSKSAANSPACAGLHLIKDDFRFFLQTYLFPIIRPDN